MLKSNLSFYFPQKKGEESVNECVQKMIMVNYTFNAQENHILIGELKFTLP